MVIHTRLWVVLHSDVFWQSWLSLQLKAVNFCLTEKLSTALDYPDIRVSESRTIIERCKITLLDTAWSCCCRCCSLISACSIDSTNIDFLFCCWEVALSWLGSLFQESSACVFTLHIAFILGLHNISLQD